MKFLPLRLVGNLKVPRTYASRLGSFHGDWEGGTKQASLRSTRNASARVLMNFGPRLPPSAVTCGPRQPRSSVGEAEPGASRGRKGGGCRAILKGAREILQRRAADGRKENGEWRGGRHRGAGRARGPFPTSSGGRDDPRRGPPVGTWPPWTGVWPLWSPRRDGLDPRDGVGGERLGSNCILPSPRLLSICVPQFPSA